MLRSCNDRCLHASTLWRCGCGPIDSSTINSPAQHRQDRGYLVLVMWTTSTTSVSTESWQWFCHVVSTCARPWHLCWLWGNHEDGIVSQTVSTCCAVLRQIGSTWRSVSQQVLQPLVVSQTIRCWLDYLALSSTWLQLVMNAGALFVCSAWKFEHITVAPVPPLVTSASMDQVQAYHSCLPCLCGTAPQYLARELCCVSNIDSRRWLRSASTSVLNVSLTCHVTISDCACSIADSRVWNSLPHDVTVSQSLSCFKQRLKTFPTRSNAVGGCFKG